MPYQGYPKKSELGRLVLLSLCLLAMLACGIESSSSGQVEATIAAGVQATQQAEANLQATIQAAVAATQQALTPGPLRQALRQAQEEPQDAASPSPPLLLSPQPPTISEAEQVRAVILSEVKSAISGDLASLQKLYGPGAIVVDHHGTPAETADDTQWQGWANIEHRYLEFLSTRFTSADLVNLRVQVQGERATVTHEGIVFDGVLYEDQALYALEKLNGQWLILRLEYGNKAPGGSLPAGAGAAPPTGRDEGLYMLAVGKQHRYEEPWGGDWGDPCTAWETGNFDDTKPDYRGFNVELLLTNNSAKKIPDEWPISFTTATGKTVKACYYRYEGSGPEPGVTRSVTFFTVVEKEDYVQTITFSLEGQTIRLCLDGKGGWGSC